MSLFFFFKQKTAYEMRISDWSSDVCSSDLQAAVDIAEFGTHIACSARGIGADALPEFLIFLAGVKPKRLWLSQPGSKKIGNYRPRKSAHERDEHEIGRA